MSKLVNIVVSASISTDFYLEVEDNATEDQIKELAKKEIILPHTYPQYIDNFLKTKLGIRVGNLDTMLKIGRCASKEKIEKYNEEIFKKYGGVK